MGPMALVVVLTLRHFGLIVRESAWIWVAAFLIVPISSWIGDRIYRTHPSLLSLHLRVIVHASGAGLIIYLTGWGPVLTGSFAIIALENIDHDGSRVWPITAFWSMVAIAIGQVLVWQGIAPSVLTLSQSNTLALLGAFVLFFIIRMAGAAEERKEVAESAVRLSEDRFRSLIQNSSDVTIVVNGEGFCTFVSPAIQELLDLAPADMVGQRATDFIHPDDHDQVVDHLTTRLHSAPEPAFVQVRMARKDGTWRDVEAVAVNQLDRPSVAGYVVNIRDITERKAFEALLAHRAMHDPLTGLANRQLVRDRAEQMLNRSRRSGEPSAAYFIDLDNFKDANDSYGHAVGDRLLQEVADRLVSLVRASDTVGRLGGDEFVILADGVSLSAGTLTLADRIHDVLRRPFELLGTKGVPIPVSASIGIAAGDRPTPEDLLRDADVALYRAKAAGRNQSVLFEPAMQLAALDRLELKSDLEAALAKEQFFLLYQPIFALDDVAVRGVEALIRWEHPTRGTVVPNDFIPILEDTGRIVEVGRWVLDEACAQAARWRDQGHPLAMSVNVSMRQLEQGGLVEYVREALDASGLDPKMLTIEVTESTLMCDPNSTVRYLTELKQLGVMIAIDDFGTGYSSLSYLRQFPADILKIDRTFVAELDGSPESTALIHMLVELGRTLGLVTLAEGIEECAQLNGLREERCDHGQGFIFSHPIRPDEVMALLG